MVEEPTFSGRGGVGQGPTPPGGGEVEARIRALFDEPLTESPGVLHVTAVCRDPDGALRTLQIGPASPQSATDAFVLALARARCDAVVTTGRILRAEPGLRHALPAALAAWRREQRGLPAAPLSVVLTGRADLDLGHPLLQASARALIVTSQSAAAAISERVAGREVEVDVEVVGRAAPSLADTLDLLHVERGLASVCVEAGPSSTRALYQEPLEVDELLLSTCLAEDVAPELQGETFASPELLAQRFRTAATVTLEEESGRWSFARLVALPHAGSRVRTGRG